MAAADTLWWTDSKHERSDSPPPETISDTYPLVQAYDPRWDDHAPDNVAPLVTDLAERMDTGPGGVVPAVVEAGLEAYIADHALGPDYRVMRRPLPTADHLRDVARYQKGAMVLLGFWEQQRDGLKLVGGHWVAVAGVGCEDNRILLSDPALNNAEAGGPGYVRPWEPHPHPDEPPDMVHNDAAWVSHGEYEMVRLAGERWHLEGYPLTHELVEHHMGMNIPPEVQAVADCYLGGPVYAVMQEIVTLVETPPLPVMRVTPSEAWKRVDQVFELDLVVDTGPGVVNAFVVHMDFDPTVLQVVGPGGGPADRIIPAGPEAAVLANAVDNVAGTIEFVVRKQAPPFEGRFRIARIPVRALRPTEGPSLVAFSFELPRDSRVVLGEQDLEFASRHCEVIVEPGATILGSVEFEGRPEPPDMSYVGPLTARFYEPGADAPRMTMPTATGENGGFVLEYLPPGVYDISVKGLHTLGKRLLAVELPPGDTELGWGVLPEGDANHSNAVNILDGSLFSAVYGSPLDQLGPCDPWVDFNQDGIVDGVDADLLTMHFWEMGDVTTTLPIALTDTLAVGEAASMADGGQNRVTLALGPSQVSVRPGGTFWLHVNALGAQLPVDGVEAHIAFDADMLEVINVIPTEALPHVFGSVVDAKAGLIHYAAGNLDGDAPVANFVAAMIQLRAKPGAEGETWAMFRNLPGSPTMAAYAGEPVLRDLQGSEIHIGLRPLHLPLILRTR